MTASRSAEIYADFLLPHLTPDTRLIDVGCGAGELTLELAPRVRRVTGLDADPADISTARRAAAELEIDNADFVVGDAVAIELPAAQADAVLAHSALEALERPADAVQEMRRILRPGGVLAVASVEYDGLIVAGPHVEATRLFFEIRKALWLAEGANPHLGKHLRGLLLAQGFSSVEAHTKVLSYGTPDTVREFGAGRADDCVDEGFVSFAVAQGLSSRSELEEMRCAWLEWSQAPTAYAAFAWCRAIGRVPS